MGSFGIENCGEAHISLIYRLKGTIQLEAMQCVLLSSYRHINGQKSSSSQGTTYGRNGQMGQFLDSLNILNIFCQHFR